jgi:hypothetical protein
MNHRVPRQTGRLTVGCNITLTLTLTLLAAVEFRRTKRMGIQRSTTEIRELELGVLKLYNNVRE